MRYQALVGFRRFNKTMKHFCSVECRAWWRRRESDLSGPWEQPTPQGYQGRLDRYCDNTTDEPDADESAAQPATIAGSEAMTVEVDA